MARSSDQTNGQNSGGIPPLRGRISRSSRSAPHPGAFLESRFLEPLGISQAELAQAIGVSRRRINELIVKLRNAKIMGAPDAGTVGNGSIVTIDMGGREMVYVLGSRDIAVATDYDVISPESPIGAAILGAKEGDTVSYKAPNGREISVTITKATPLQ